MLRKTLNNKLILLIVSTIVFFGLLACLSVFTYSEKTLTQNKKNDLFNLIVEESHVLDQTFLFNNQVTQKIASNQQVIEYFEGEQKVQDKNILDFLKNYTFSDTYLAIYLLDKQGYTKVSTDERFVGQDYSFRDYFKQAVKGNNFLDANIGVTSGDLGYYFAMPVKDQKNNILGVLVTKLNPAAIEKTLHLPFQNEIEGGVMLVNSEGIILFSSDEPERKFKSLSVLSDEFKNKIAEGRKFPNIQIIPLDYSEAQKQIELGKNEFVYEFYDEIDKENEFINGVKVADTTFYIVLEVYSSYLRQQALWAAILLAIFILFCAASSVLFIIIIITRTFKPLQKLKETTEAISVGNFNKKVDIKTGDELEELGNTINSMIDSLRDSYSNLESSVSKKTKELADQLQKMSEKNKILADTQKAVVNVLEDIQEEKNISENLARDLLKFQLAVENASDHIIIADPDGKILYANKAATEITGYSFEEMKGKTPSLWGKQMPIEFYKKFWQTIKYDKKTFAGEITNKRKNGELYIADIHVVPILKQNGDVQFFVGIERDITKAKEIDKAKTEFVSLASHQLRTPLTAISWYIEMLLSGKAGKLKEEQKNYLEEVYKGNVRMRDLVNALLNVSRIDMGSFIIEPEKINIADMADSLIEEMQALIAKKKLKIIEKNSELPKDYSADPKLLRIVLQNLLSNAVKYTPNKGKITIAGKQTNEELIISVADTGYGIPAGQQKKIFTKFFRADNARIKDPEGTGLGLYIVKSILDYSGGRIWFESKENEGTTFYVSLPLKGMQKRAGEKGLI